MARFKRILRYTLLSLLLLLLLSASLLGWMLATESGSRWLIGRAVAFVPGELGIEQVSGRLIRDLRLSGIRYRNGELAVSGDSLALDWQPAGLLSGDLLIERLALGNIDLHLPPSTEESEPPPSTGPVQLPQQISLPLAIEIRALSLGRVRLYSGDAEQPMQQLDEARLSLDAREGELKLTQLALRSPQADLDLAGSATLGGDYPLDITTKWRLRLPRQSRESDVQEGDATEPVRLDGQGRLAGDLTQLDLQQQIEGAVTAQLTARLDQVLSDLRWQARLELTRVDIEQLLADPSPELLALQPEAELQASGDLNSAQLSLELAVSLPELQRTRLRLVADASPQRIEVQELRLQPEQGDTRFTAVGRIEDPLGERRVDADLNWQALHYPLAAATPQYSSSIGELKVEGTLDAYRLSLQSEVEGVDLPTTRLSIEGQGNSEGLQLKPLRADTLGGRVDITGAVNWVPQPSWELTLTAQGLQPERHWPDLPGRLNGRLLTQGALGQQLEARVQIEQLGGTLKGQPVQGTGQVQMAGSAVSLDQLDLGWGGTRVQVSGEITEQLALQWQLQIPDLGMLLPGAGGRIQGEGRLSGEPGLPAVDAELAIAELSYEETRVEQLDARVQFDPSWQTAVDIQLRARRILGAGQAIRSAELSVSGTDRKLQIALDADAEPTARLSLRADGRLTTDLQQDPVYWAWAGQLTRLDITNPQAGRWAMTAPASISAEPRRYRLGPLCLAPRDLEGTACIEGESAQDAQGSSAQASLQVDSLSLALLAPFIPEPAEIVGRVDAQARFRLNGERIRYDARVELPQAVLSMPDSDLSLTLDRSRLTLLGDRNSAEAEVDIGLAPLKGGIQGLIKVQELTGAQRLDGELNARIEQLRPLAVLLPALQIQGGSAGAALNIAGSVQQPQLTGKLAVHEGDIELPAAGIRVSEIELDLADDPAHAGWMRFDGSALSGQGRLVLQGSLRPMQQSAELSLKGERFEAMKTEEVRLLVSPDLQLALSPETVRVRGELVIPEALIQAPKPAQSAISASPDLVVRSDDGVASSKGPELDIDLRVVLGDSVRVDALGFNGLLTGALNLQQQGRGLARGTGSVGVASGQYRLYGQDLNISRGNVIFTGGPLSNPGLDLRVEREIDEVTVGALVGGTLREPDLKLTSSPAMPDNRILSYLVLGRAPDGASAGEQQMLMKLALSLGAKGGTSITEKLSQSLNVDEIGFASGETVDDTSFYIGKYLSPDLYIKYGVGLINPVNTFLMRYQLSKRLSLETETSAVGSGGDLIYSFEKD